VIRRFREKSRLFRESVRHTGIMRAERSDSLTALRRQRMDHLLFLS